MLAALARVLLVRGYSISSCRKVAFRSFEDTCLKRAMSPQNCAWPCVKVHIKILTVQAESLSFKSANFYMRKHRQAGGCMQANAEAAGDNRSSFHGGYVWPSNCSGSGPSLIPHLSRFKGGKAPLRMGMQVICRCQHCIHSRLSAHTMAATVVSADAKDVTECWLCCCLSILCAVAQTSAPTTMVWKSRKLQVMT